MARHNEIYVGHFNRFIQKFTGIKGGPPSPQLSGDFQPVIPVFVGNEARYLAAWNYFGNWQDVPAGAALTGGVQLQNPAGSNVIAVITRIFCAVGAAATVRISQPSGAQTPANLGSAGAAVRGFDSRQGASFNSTCIISSQNSPSVGTLNSVPTKHDIATANSDVDLLFPTQSNEWPLVPGDTLRVTCDLANTRMKVVMIWRERFLEESERT